MPYWTLGVLLLLILFFGVVGTNFLSKDNWIATSLYANTIIPLALAETFVIISGGIDLSVSGTMGFAGLAGAMAGHAALDAHAGGPAAALVMAAVAIGVGAVVGVINGGLIARLSLSPFIVTLGMQGIMRGGTNLLNNGQEETNVPQPLIDLGTTLVFDWVPLIVLISFVLVAVSGVILSRTRFGVHTYALGSNPEGARRAGIHVNRHLVLVYGTAGLLSGVAGLMLTSRFAVATTQAGQGYELTAIAAVVIGGGSLYGGRGTALGSLVGTAIISVLLTGLLLAGVPAFWQVVVTGVIIIVAVFLDQLQVRVQQR